MSDGYKQEEEKEEVLAKEKDSLRWVSIDVGTKNLAYCIVDVSNNDNEGNITRKVNIRRWNVVSIMDIDASKILVDQRKSLQNNKKEKKEKKAKGHKPSLIEIGICLKKRFDQLGMNRAGIDGVIIENQIAPIASNMKSLQCMIMQYFVMNSVENVHFISATAKLKHAISRRTQGTQGADGGGGKKAVKPGYKERKNIGIDLCRRMLNILEGDEKQGVQWGVFFEKHRKKDDLADAYIQSLAFFNIDCSNLSTPE